MKQWKVSPEEEKGGTAEDAVQSYVRLFCSLQGACNPALMAHPCIEQSKGDSGVLNRENVRDKKVKAKKMNY